MTDILIKRSDGKELKCTGGITTNGWTVEYEGLADFLDVPIDIQTSANVLRDGSSLVSKRVGECERTATILYVGTRPRATVRDEALSFFNPKFSFEVHVTHLGRTRWCPGELSAVQFTIEQENRPCRCTFSILSIDPYMRSEDGNESSLTDAAPMFGFPYVSHMRQVLPDKSKKPVGSLASKMIFDGENTIYNTGDVATWFKIVCRFKSVIKNPVFTKDDKHVQLLREFADGDELVVDFESSPPKVTVNGENAIQACSRDSDFLGMEMKVGASVFNYTCDNTDNRPYMSVQVLFWKRYMGV